jgi:hypothetical protein
MLEALYEAERLLPSLLATEDGWTGLFADTEKPNLTRVWRQWGENRISLHVFGPCASLEVFPHPHEWDSAIRILEGECEMGMGVLTSHTHRAAGVILPVPEDCFGIVMPPGTAYQMIGSYPWHWVRPTGPHGYASLMVSGPPLYPQNRVRKNTPSRILTAAQISDQLTRFRRHYPD